MLKRFGEMKITSYLCVTKEEKEVK